MLVAQRLELTPSFETMGVQVLIGRNAAATESVSVWYRVRGSAEPFREGHPLVEIEPGRFAGSLFQLSPDTDYEVSARSESFSTDSIRFGRTRSDTFPAPSGTTLYVSAEQGSDANDGLSPDRALASLARALPRVAPGSRIVLDNGVYFEGDLRTERSGTADNPIVIEAAPGATAVLDGSDPGFEPNWQPLATGSPIYRTLLTSELDKAYLDGNHFFRHASLADLRNKRWNLPGFYSDGRILYARFPNDDPPTNHIVRIPRFSTGITFLRAAHWQIKDLQFQNYGKTAFHRGIYLEGSDHFLIQSCRFDQCVIGVGIRGAAHFNVIQDCDFRDAPLPDWDWNAVKSGAASYEGGGVFVYGSDEANTGNVVRRNRFIDQFDAAHIASMTAAGPSENFDFYDNTVTNMGDDALETDGTGVNLRIFRNHFDGFLTGVSVAPAHLGPTFVTRNYFLNWRSSGAFTGYPIKLNSDSPLSTRFVYVYHNTCYTDIGGQDGFLIRRYSNWSDIVSRNNIYAGTDYALESVSARHPISFDYDVFYSRSPTRFIRWAGRSYTNLPAFAAATGQMLHGIQGEPEWISSFGSGPAAEPPEPVRDRGLRIPGINDDFSGSAPDIGAQEYLTQGPDLGLAAAIESVVYSQGSIRIRFLGISGQQYEIQERTELVPSSAWSPRSLSAEAGTDGRFEYVSPIQGSVRFFRAVTVE